LTEVVHHRGADKTRIAFQFLRWRRHLQPASGSLKVRFYLRDLLLRTDYKKLMKAQLVIKPFQNPIRLFQLPPQVNLYATDQSNTQGTAISSETEVW
jgi:hypothetical protein